MKFKLKPSPKVAPTVSVKKILLYSIAFTAFAGVAGFFLFFYLNVGAPQHALAAPPVDISGVINSYLRVTNINVANSRFVANNLSGNISDFQVGKTIMIHQAKGATITTSNNASYGTVTSYNNAGRYELTKVASITGSSPYTITVTSLVNSYTVSGNVQLVSVPQYTDANVTGNITPTPWSSMQGRGGIVAMEVSGTLTLGADINASNAGFDGGQTAGSDGGCPSSTTYISGSDNYGAKGEGITAFSGSNQYARGPQANGGGGGNPHNAGGGGGSNFTLGGNGGQGYQPGGGCSDQDAGGLAGKDHNYTTSFDRLFFGGGGGAGQQNNGLASDGGKGGGIILVRAHTIQSACAGTYGFLANGEDAANSTGNDGAGGGGGGGIVLLDVRNYVLTCNISARANGGNGGNVTDAAAHGGGGGGGIGVIMEVTPSTSSSTVFSSTQGTNGNDCTTCSFSGTAPATPTTSRIGIGPVPGQTIVLPIELGSFTGYEEDAVVVLEWTTLTEINNHFFTIERSKDGKDFQPVLEVKGAGNSQIKLKYSATDVAFFPRATYYRLKQTDFDEKFSYSDVIFVKTSESEKKASFYPNPASDFVNIQNPTGQAIQVKIVDDKGSGVFFGEIDETSLAIPVSDWKQGIYIIEISSDGSKDIKRLLIRR